MDAPRPDWTLTASSSPVLGLLYRFGSALALSTWRRPLLARARERLAYVPGRGHLQLSA